MGLLRRKFILLVILLASSFILPGCGPVGEKAGGGSVKAGSTYSWPSEIPSDVPTFSYAEISEIIEDNEEAGKFFTLTLTEVENYALETYKSDLESNGWTIEFIQQFEEVWSMIAVKDARGIQVLDNGDGTGMLSYLPDISKF